MHYDVVILGGGMIGLGLARLLIEHDPLLSIAVIESSGWRFDAPDDLRVSAFNAASIGHLQRWGLWTPEQFPRRGFYRRMEVWDEASSGKLMFRASELGLPFLGAIVPNQSVVKALWNQVSGHPSVKLYTETTWTEFQEPAADFLELVLSTGERITTNWLAGTDGAASPLRERLAIPCERKSYGQSAIVANIQLEHPHQSMAYQRFLHTGPVAVLPLQHSNEASIVWSLPEEKMTFSLKSKEDVFNAELTEALSCRLGKLTLSSQRAAFPLKHHHAKQYLKGRAFLLGDAAHGIHPLAGLGVNLGFHDLSLLHQIFTRASAEHRSLLSEANFKSYERNAWAYNESVHQGMSALKMGFQPQGPLASIRGWGMDFVNHFGIVKTFFSRSAQGIV